MSKIILQPSGNKGARKHYADTIENSVSLKRIKPFVSISEFERLQEIYPSGECKIWGVTPGGYNLAKWNKIEVGDVTLFSKEGAIYASAVTTFKLHSQDLASELWGHDIKGQTWEYIYFLEELKNHNIPYVDFNRAVGYSENNVIQGFNVLKPEQSVVILRTFDLESDTFSKEITLEAYEDILSKLAGLEKTEEEIMSSRRLEQIYLKRKLFGKRTRDTCAACKKDFPVSFLVTAHIKKRSCCSIDERKDLNVVMPMCKMGCDEIYEKGYIGVSNGIFVDIRRTPNSKHLQDYIDQILGTKCEYFNDQTKDYFDWHYQHHS
ncbi:hypothetical protein WIW50_11545 [Flavobacteriaceae bacterium 3-367]